MERDANKFRLVTFSINKNFNGSSSFFFQIVIYCLSNWIGEIINRANYRLYRFKFH